MLRVIPKTGTTIAILETHTGFFAAEKQVKSQKSKVKIGKFTPVLTFDF
jgi:hypothetical protein